MSELDALKRAHVISGYTPDDDDDAVEDVVGVPQVLEEAKGGELQDHLQREHAGENDVADLQDVGQLVGLGTVGEEKNTAKTQRLENRLEETE